MQLINLWPVAFAPCWRRLVVANALVSNAGYGKHLLVHMSVALPWSHIKFVQFKIRYKKTQIRSRRSPCQRQDIRIERSEQCDCRKKSSKLRCFLDGRNKISEKEDQSLIIRYNFILASGY